MEKIYNWLDSSLNLWQISDHTDIIHTIYPVLENVQTFLNSLCSVLYLFMLPFFFFFVKPFLIVFFPLQFTPLTSFFTSTYAPPPAITTLLSVSMSPFLLDPSTPHPYARAVSLVSCSYFSVLVAEVLECALKSSNTCPLTSSLWQSWLL